MGRQFALGKPYEPTLAGGGNFRPDPAWPMGDDGPPVRRAAGDLADGTVVDQMPRMLVCAAEECVWSGTDANALLFRTSRKILSFLHREHEGLFGIDVLAGVDHGFGDFVVRGGDGEIDDDVNVSRLQKTVYRFGS